MKCILLSNKDTGKMYKMCANSDVFKVCLVV